MSKNACVIGGAGYLGMQLVNRLLAEGLSVRVVDNMMYGQNLSDLDVEVISGDVAEPMIARRAVAGVDYLFFAAGLIGDTTCDMVDPQLARRANQDTMMTVIDQLREHTSPPRLIFLSSGSVYGRQMRAAASEDDTPCPATLYAETRLRSDEYVLSSSVPAIILRLGCLFGWSARMRLDMVINRMTAEAVSRGNISITDSPTLRPHIHIEDVVDVALLAAVADDKYCGQIFNVGSDQLAVTDQQAAAIVASVVPSDIILSSVPAATEQYSIAHDKIRSLWTAAPRTIAEGATEIAARLHELGNIDDDKYYNIRAIQQFIQRS